MQSNMNQSSIKSLRWVFQKVISKKYWGKWRERKPQSNPSQYSNILHRNIVGIVVGNLANTSSTKGQSEYHQDEESTLSVLRTDWHVGMDLQILAWSSGDISCAVMICWVFDTQTVSSLASGLLFRLTTGHFHTSLLSKYFLTLWNKAFSKDGRHIISIVLTSTEVELNAG